MIVKSLLLFILGASLGSFFNLIVDRYEKKESFILKPSYCFNCNKKLYWWHNVPILGYLFLKGKCFFCNYKINISCFISELFVSLISVIIFYSAQKNDFNLINSVALYSFCMTLIFLSMFDLRHKIVPHLITYTAIIFVIIYKLFLGINYKNVFIDLGATFIFMDILYLTVTLIKRLKLDNNILSFPLGLWGIVSIFFPWVPSIKLIFIPITVYFILLNFPISLKYSILSWGIVVLALIFQLYKAIFIDLSLNSLSLFFAGIGIIYFVGEVLFYYFTLIKQGIDPKTQELSSEVPECENKYALGGGDITVLALISVYLGIKVVVLILFLASILALISYYILRPLLINRFLKQAQSQYIAFVPYITTACFIIIFINHGT